MSRAGRATGSASANLERFNVLESYLTFVAWPSTAYSVSVLVGLSVAAIRSTSTPNRAQVLAIAVAAPFVVYALLLLSAMSIEVSVPEWWPSACIAAGIIAGMLALGATEGNVFAGLVAGFGTRALLEWALGPYLIFPFIKYAFGHGLTLMAPVAAVLLWGAGLVKLALRSGARLTWPIAAFLCLGAAAGTFLATPALSDAARRQFADVLQALAPCVLIVVVFGLHRRLATLIYGVVFLFVWVAGLLQTTVVETPAGVNGLGLSLTSAPAVWTLCLVAAAAVAVHVYQLMIPRRGSQTVLLWAVAMPWISLAPAWHFFQQGLGQFAAFVAANLVIGLLLIAGFSFPVGRFNFAAGASRWVGSVPAGGHEPTARIISAGLVLGVAVISYVVPWQWFATVSLPPLEATSPSVEVLFTSEPAGASIVVDGSVLGATPARLTMPVDDAAHDAKFVLAGYAEVAHSFKLTGQTTPVVNVTMTRLAAEPRNVNVVFTSEPSGARVVVDGRPVGTTPARLTMPGDAVSHAAIFSLNGYVPSTHAFRIVSKGQRQTVSTKLDPDPPPAQDEEQPTMVPGVLAVTADYPVEVRVQGTTRTAASRHLIPLGAGFHQIGIAAPQVFLDESRRVEVVSGQTLEMAAPAVTTVRVVCTVPGCALTVNGRSVGQPPLDVRIATGQRPRFELTWPGRRLECTEAIGAASRFLFADPNNQQCVVRE